MSRAPIPPIKIPMAPKASRAVNDTGRQVSELASMDATGGAFNRGPTGLSLVNTAPILKKAQWYGVIVNAGPDASGDFTDDRYWIQEVVFVQSEMATPTDSATAYFRPNGNWVVGLNLAEMAAASHTLTAIAASADWSGSATSGTLVKVTLIHGGKITTVSDDQANHLYVFEAVNATAAPPFVVNVTQTSGSSGSGTTACSFVYSAYSLAGTLLATGLTPVWARPALGKLVAATHGTGYYASGSFVLYQVDEVPAKMKRSC